MHIHFRIGNLMSPKELYGDGMAIWLTKDRMVHGNVFGSIDYFQGLGIFLDTYRLARTFDLVYFSNPLPIYSSPPL